jgi:hypothetical protein
MRSCVLAHNNASTSSSLEAKNISLDIQQALYMHASTMPFIAAHCMTWPLAKDFFAHVNKLAA